MNDRKRQLRKLLEGYRDRAAAITFKMPELEALAARHVASGAAVVENPAPVAERAPEPVREPEPEAEPELASVTPAPAPARPAPPARAEARPKPAEAPASGSGFARMAWLGAALMIALGGGWWARNERLHHQNIHQVLPLPMSSSVGLARGGDVFYSFDRTRMLIGTIDPVKGGLISLKRFPNGMPTGLAASADKLWSADANGFLYEHALTGDYAVRRTFANPSRRPCALHWDGAHLWIADSRTNSIYEYTVGVSLSAARQFTLPTGVTPAALHVENGLVWVLDAASRTIYRFRARALLEPVDSMSLEPWIASPRQPTGMVLDDKSVWISVDGPPELHRFDLSLLPWRADS